MIMFISNNKHDGSVSKPSCLFGPSAEIRTRGLLNPIQARYQTSPHPDFFFVAVRVRQLSYNSMGNRIWQVLFEKKLHNENDLFHV